MDWPPLPQSLVSVSVDVVFDAARPPTAEAQPAGHSLPAARARGRALMRNGSAAAWLHTKRLYRKQFLKLTASKERSPGSESRASQARLIYPCKAKNWTRIEPLACAPVISIARETSLHRHLPRVPLPAEIPANPASSLWRGRSASRTKYALLVMTTWQSCHHPV